MGLKGKSKYDGVFSEGQTFGRYTILASTIKVEHEAKVECKCECGTIRWVSCYSLVKETSTQCSKCGNSMVKSNNPAWKGYGDIPSRVFGKLRRDAGLRNLEFNISIEYCDKLYKEQKGVCNLSGVKLNTSINGSSTSLDRIDNSEGYIEGNVQWLHKDVNMMKRTYTQEHFINMCKSIAELDELEKGDIVFTEPTTRGRLVKMVTNDFLLSIIWESFSGKDELQKVLDLHLNFETMIDTVVEEDGRLTGNIFYKAVGGDKEYRVTSFTVYHTGIIA